MIRKIIRIDEEKCDGCALCIPNCPEGAIQIVEGKARLVSDIFCDGLGACLGHCPQGAITTEEREADAYDERLVIENISKQGPEVVKAHLEHLREHEEWEYLKIAEHYLAEQQHKAAQAEKPQSLCGCPGAAAKDFKKKAPSPAPLQASAPVQADSGLTHWPIQLHLISPASAHFQGCDLLVAADCAAFSHGAFHQKLLQGKKLTIFCPKLDQGMDIYRQKILALIDDAKVNTVTVAIMQVPCCRGMLQVVMHAAQEAKRRVPIKCVIVGVEGDLLSEEWVSS